MVVSFIDIHTHILPGVDDGAKDLAESLRIVKDAIRVGVKEIILTPHFFNNGVEFDNIFYQFTSFVKTVSEEGCNIKLHLGSELMLCPELPVLIKNDHRLTIRGKGKYVLIEMPLTEIPFYAPNVFFSLLSQGITPIWAHPERCYDVVQDTKKVGDYVKNGVLLQINMGSLLGIYGKKVKSSVTALLKNGYGNAMASDVHKDERAIALLPKAFLHLEKIVGNAKALDMVFTSPAKILNDF